jgi:hypothetical protein
MPGRIGTVTRLVIVCGWGNGAVAREQAREDLRGEGNHGVGIRTVVEVVNRALALTRWPSDMPLVFWSTWVGDCKINSSRSAFLVDRFFLQVTRNLPVPLTVGLLGTRVTQSLYGVLGAMQESHVTRGLTSIALSDGS